ncbi:CidA/LrgA family holin-like protein [Bacillaceae bacterium Marseille-Q3522]|nr:CidA/LrgA family holin-like protein [Bacillaceae bacterium Marseille-Q3522]
MKIAIGMLQVFALLVFSLIMGKISELLHLKIPGSILGMILLFILLKKNIIKLKWIEAGSNWLLAELLLFFIPSAVGIIQYQDLMADNGIQIILIIFLSSLVVMITSGILAEVIARKGEKKNA